MLSTKDIKVGEGSGNVSPLIKPGIHKVRIYDLYAEKPGYNDANAPDKLNVNLRVETEEVPGLQGWKLYRDNPNSPLAKGQIGTVSLNPYGFSSRKLQDGTLIDRDTSILRILKALAKAKGVEEELDLIEANTIEQFVSMAKEVICDNEFIHMVIGGKKSAKDGYFNYYLNLASGKGRPGKAFSTDATELFAYDESTDIYVTKAAEELAAEKAQGSKPVESFNSNTGTPSGSFEL